MQTLNKPSTAVFAGVHLAVSPVSVRCAVLAPTPVASPEYGGAAMSSAAVRRDERRAAAAEQLPVSAVRASSLAGGLEQATGRTKRQQWTNATAMSGFGIHGYPSWRART